MMRKENSKALGRGLKALIGDKIHKTYEADENAASPTEIRAQNMEFYGSLMKQYVQSGENDVKMEEMLDSIREHLEITLEEHMHLLQTLRKREASHPKTSDPNILKVQDEMRQELKQLFDEFKQETDSTKTAVEAFSEIGEVQEPIPLPERTPNVVSAKEEAIQAPPWSEQSPPFDETKLRKVVIPRDLDQRAGIITDTATKGRTTVEWLDEGTKFKLEMPPPAQPGPEQAPGAGPGVLVEEHPPAPEELQEVVEEPSSMEGAAPEMEPVLEEIPEAAGKTETAESIPSRSDPTDIKTTKPPLEDSLISLKLLMEERKTEEAFDMSNRLLERMPDDLALLNERGVLLYAKGRIDESMAIYRKVLEMDPDSVETMINYAIVLSTKGLLDDSLKCLENAVSKDPYNEDAWNNKAVVLSKAGRLRDALNCLDEALRINDRSISTWLNSGIILERMGEFGPAMECYRKLLQIDPGNETALEGLEFCKRELAS